MKPFEQQHRPEYMSASSLAKNPLQQFELWYAQAQQSAEVEPHAMVLATVSAQNKPSGRIVLYKGLVDGAFTFYTNYGSRKALELAANPWASLTFYWKLTDRQVRVEGRVVKTSLEQSREYFASRPRLSQLSAWASEQSAELENRAALEEKMRLLEANYPAGTPIPLPPFWGGYRLLPDLMEFWQQGPDRLHDRFVYRRMGKNWNRGRLAP